MAGGNSGAWTAADPAGQGAEEYTG
jgi:hypothetical protein